MMLNINLPGDSEKRLRQQAASAGKDIAEFVQEAIEEKLAATQPPPAKIRTPRLANPAQAAEFAKQVVEGADHATL
jgi:hypothetical protein